MSEFRYSGSSGHSGPSEFRSIRYSDSSGPSEFREIRSIRFCDLSEFAQTALAKFAHRYDRSPVLSGSSERNSLPVRAVRANFAQIALTGPSDERNSL